MYHIFFYLYIFKLANEGEKGDMGLAGLDGTPGPRGLPGPIGRIGEKVGFVALKSFIDNISILLCFKQKLRYSFLQYDSRLSLFREIGACKDYPEPPVEMGNKIYMCGFSQKCIIYFYLYIYSDYLELKGAREIAATSDKRVSSMSACYHNFIYYSNGFFV